MSEPRSCWAPAKINADVAPLIQENENGRLKWYEEVKDGEKKDEMGFVRSLFDYP
jgi:hypothetical protein